MEQKEKMYPINMKAGRYYIGDLCYVMGDHWNEICDLTIDEKSGTVKNGVFTMKNGIIFAMYHTVYGDGTYRDYEGREYLVDSGSIGAVLINDLDPDVLKNVVEIKGNGHIIRFPEDFRSYMFEGEISFGRIYIQTDISDHEDCDNDLDLKDIIKPYTKSTNTKV